MYVCTHIYHLVCSGFRSSLSVSFSCADPFCNVLQHCLVLVRLRYEIKRLFGATVVVAIRLSRFLLVQSLLCFYSLFFCVGKPKKKYIHILKRQKESDKCNEAEKCVQCIK